MPTIGLSDGMYARLLNRDGFGGTGWSDVNCAVSAFSTGCGDPAGAALAGKPKTRSIWSAVRPRAPARSMPKATAMDIGDTVKLSVRVAAWRYNSAPNRRIPATTGATSTWPSGTSARARSRVNVGTVTAPFAVGWRLRRGTADG